MLMMSGTRLLIFAGGLTGGQLSPQSSANTAGSAKGQQAKFVHWGCGIRSQSTHTVTRIPGGGVGLCGGYRQRDTGWSGFAAHTVAPYSKSHCSRRGTPPCVASHSIELRDSRAVSEWHGPGNSLARVP